MKTEEIIPAPATQSTSGSPSAPKAKAKRAAAPAISIPLRRMTQAEIDAFLEKAADILRGNVDHSEFRGYVFALLFFKRISDVFEESVRKLAKEVGDELAQDPVMQRKALPFVVPPECLWEVVTSGTKEKPVSSLTLGQSLNDAMLAIERANAPKFDGILTSKIDFNKQDELPRTKLVELKNHFSSQKFDRAHVPDNLFGDAYEYLIRTFASKAGKSSGEFYTPKEVSYLMSEIVEPAEQHEVCDWAGGSGSLLLQCREYLRRHGKDPNRLFLFAQESNVATYNISRINLILHGINSWHHAQGDSLRIPKHLTTDNKLKQFDRIVMNPPFSLESWGIDDFTDGDPFDRFVYGMPPRDNGDYAWMQHVLKSLKPEGKAIVVMSQGILFRGQPQLTEAVDGRNKKADDEHIIRAGFLKDDLIEAIIVLPSGIFYGNNVPACLAILNKRKHQTRKNKVLLVWASRHYQHANPQSFLRRADCLRILLAWRAFGDLPVASKILPKEGASILDEIHRDRERALLEIREAYDPILSELPLRQKEIEDNGADSLKRWLGCPRAEHPIWGVLYGLTSEIAALQGKKPCDTSVLKSKKDALRLLVKESKEKAGARIKIAKGMVKALEKLQKERDERIREVEQQSSRETSDVQEAIEDLKRVCSSPAESRRYFVVASTKEIQENEFNLNVPRYVDTFEPEEKIELPKAIKDLAETEAAVLQASKEFHAILDKTKRA